MKILFQGDSITDCGRLSSGGAGYEYGRMGPGYPGLVKARLCCDHPELALEFMNRGVSGDRVVDLYARWRVDCINLAPDVLSLLIGVNDSWHENTLNGVEVPRARRIYNELLDWTVEKLPLVKLILLEPFVATGSEHGGLFTTVRRRADYVREAAVRFGGRAVFVPLQEIFDRASGGANGWRHWLADGIHPTPAGHQLIADAWIAAAAGLIGLQRREACGDKKGR